MGKFDLSDHIKGSSRENVVVWLFNIGVEKCWNKLTNAVKDPNEDIVVNHIEEINLLITKKQDCMILRKIPSETFLEELINKGYEIPNIICPCYEDETKSISELVLMDDSLLQLLTSLGKNDNTYFVPYGVSELEEKIARISGLHLIGGTGEDRKIVNNKIFSKTVAHKLGLPTADEYVCQSIDEIREAFHKLNDTYKKVIIKMPCNSSGQGMWVIDSEKRLNMVCTVIKRMFNNQDDRKWLVEGWIEKQCDLNLQVYVSEDGHIQTFSVKEQVVDGTLYVGSVMPARITTEQYNMCLKYGKEIGEYLYFLGYTGIFGIDSLIDKEGKVIPIIEINGRFTLSTYLSFVIEKHSNKVMYSFYKRLRAKKFNYDILKMQLTEVGIWMTELEGIFVYNAATVDCELACGYVRVFCMVIGENYEYINRVIGEFNKICNESIAHSL